MQKIAISYADLEDADTEIGLITDNDVPNMETALSDASEAAGNITMASIEVSPAQNSVTAFQDELTGLSGRITDLIETAQEWDSNTVALFDSICLGLDVRFDAGGNVMAADWDSLLVRLQEPSMESIFGKQFVRDMKSLFERYVFANPADRASIASQIAYKFSQLPPYILAAEHTFKTPRITIPGVPLTYSFQYVVELSLSSQTPEARIELKNALTEQLISISASVPMPGGSFSAGHDSIGINTNAGSVSVDPRTLLLGTASVTFMTPPVRTDDIGIRTGVNITATLTNPPRVPSVTVVQPPPAEVEEGWLKEFWGKLENAGESVSNFFEAVPNFLEENVEAIGKIAVTAVSAIAGGFMIIYVGLAYNSFFIVPYFPFDNDTDNVNMM